MECIAASQRPSEFLGLLLKSNLYILDTYGEELLQVFLELTYVQIKQQLVPKGVNVSL